jgi:hypothetical protein
MKDIRDRVKTSYKRLGTVLLILFALLFSAGLSWLIRRFMCTLNKTSGSVYIRQR